MISLLGLKPFIEYGRSLIFTAKLLRKYLTLKKILKIPLWWRVL
jgi:hypothetical protein